nr:NADH pyrophosphatase zinc ribbon domain-containing protein [Micromonospora sp. DSM 115978]
MTLGALVGVALLGFLAGLFSFKIKARWCPRCGGTTVPAERGRRAV